MASNKLSSKAAKLDFSNLPGALPARALPDVGGGALGVLANVTAGPTPVTPGPKTAPGALMAFANDARSSLMRENDTLREQAAQASQLQGRLDEALQDLQQWDGAKATRLLDPTRIHRSRFANRHELNFNGTDYEQLKAEISSAGGNVQPIKVRRLAAAEGAQAGDEQYELVFGHRRHQACLELGLPVLAVVDNLDDRALFVEMDRENRSRKDLSAWEQGQMYQRALDEGLFPSNRKLAEAVGVDLGNLGRALSLARLPVEVVNAFPSPLDLQFRWAKLLSDALAADAEGVLRRASGLVLEKGRWPAKAVLERLVQEASAEPSRAARGLYGTTPPADPVTLRVGNKTVAQIETTASGELAIQIPAGVLPAERLQALADHLRAFFVKG